jgi:hypothetical protein
LIGSLGRSPFHGRHAVGINVKSVSPKCSAARRNSASRRAPDAPRAAEKPFSALRYRLIPRRDPQIRWLLTEVLVASFGGGPQVRVERSAVAPKRSAAAPQPT